jgi:hypothetical protein
MHPVKDQNLVRTQPRNGVERDGCLADHDPSSMTSPAQRPVLSTRLGTSAVLIVPPTGRATQSDVQLSSRSVPPGTVATKQLGDGETLLDPVTTANAMSMH